MAPQTRSQSKATKDPPPVQPDATPSSSPLTGLSSAPTMRRLSMIPEEGSSTIASGWPFHRSPGHTVAQGDNSSEDAEGDTDKEVDGEPEEPDTKDDYVDFQATKPKNKGKSRVIKSPLKESDDETDQLYENENDQDESKVREAVHHEFLIQCYELGDNTVTDQQRELDCYQHERCPPGGSIGRTDPHANQLQTSATSSLLPVVNADQFQCAGDTSPALLADAAAGDYMASMLTQMLESQNFTSLLTTLNNIHREHNLEGVVLMTNGNGGYAVWPIPALYVRDLNEAQPVPPHALEDFLLKYSFLKWAHCWCNRQVMFHVV
ncbi:hypothetical protein V5O48_015547 [Marasmius crinis-equi]|uniref:Uncharacterized protein n=1 Tax=Marasmius crinis-equi TaxID=585013 RepID=A0ABR3EUA6_9AGAR